MHGVKIIGKCVQHFYVRELPIAELKYWRFRRFFIILNSFNLYNCVLFLIICDIYNISDFFYIIITLSRVLSCYKNISKMPVKLLCLNITAPEYHALTQKRQLSLSNFLLRLYGLLNLNTSIF